MHCTGHTSTQALSFVPMHASVITYGSAMAGLLVVGNRRGPTRGRVRSHERSVASTRMNDPSVTDHPDRHRFELEVDGVVAELVYRREGDRLVLVHTGVPDELGGRGLGGVLVQAAVDQAATEGVTIVPECPYARAWLEKHPDQAGRVTIDWPERS